MHVRVRIPPVLRAEAGGSREVEASGSTVHELLENLRATLPQLGDKVYDGEQIAPFVNVYLDGEDVRTLSGVDTPVAEGATLILLPAMAGGQDARRLRRACARG
jgi:molybdopterin converting factor small subunit